MVIEDSNCNLNHVRKIVKVEIRYTATSQVPRALTMGGIRVGLLFKSVYMANKSVLQKTTAWYQIVITATFWSSHICMYFLTHVKS